MRQAKSSSHDLLLAVLLTVAGGAFVMAALFNHWNPNEMNPGVEGALTAVALCPVFGLLHGLSYTDTLKISAPVLGIAMITCRAIGAPVLAVAGISLLVIGALGFLASLRAPARRRPRRRAVSVAPRLAH